MSARQRRRPGVRRVGPRAAGVEARRLDRSLAGLLQLRKRRRARLTNREGLGPIGTDAEDPGPQRRAAFEPIERSEHVAPGVLRDLLRGGAAAHERHRDAHEAPVQLAHERGERDFVASAQLLDQRCAGA